MSHPLAFNDEKIDGFTSSIVYQPHHCMYYSFFGYYELKVIAEISIGRLFWDL